MTDEYVLRSSVLKAIHNGDIDMGMVTAHEYRLLKDLSERIDRRIQRVPAADVAPVRHGLWVKARGSWCTPGGDPVWECSECGKGRHVYGIEHGTYGSDVADGQWVSCPNCGAKMGGE